MLPAPHRLTSPGDFAAVMRQGRRAGSSTVVVTARVHQRTGVRSWRCGFIVSKAVGNAVVRHRTTRRLRHLVAELMPQHARSLPEGISVDIAVRALAESADAEHRQLRTDLDSCLRRALNKVVRP